MCICIRHNYHPFLSHKSPSYIMCRDDKVVLRREIHRYQASLLFRNPAVHTVLFTVFIAKYFYFGFECNLLFANKFKLTWLVYGAHGKDG